MNKKDLYYKLTERYFDMGLLREVYSSDSVSVCNLANSFYLAVPFEEIEDVVIGVVTNTEGLKKIIENNDYVYEMANDYLRGGRKKYIVQINDKLARAFLPIKQKRENPGCESPDVNLEFEEELKRKAKSM